MLEVKEPGVKVVEESVPHSLDEIIKIYKVKERLNQLVGDEKSSDTYPELTFEFLRARFNQLTLNE